MWKASAAAVLFVWAGVVPGSASSEPLLGEIQTFAFKFCPVGFAPMDGALLPINENKALFSLLGTTYGGDGTTTFALPKATAVYTEPVELLQCIATFGVYPSRP
jgi:microcystin-dependent protein